MSDSGPFNEALLEFLKLALARDSEVRDDIVARIESGRFVDVLGRRSTAARAGMVIEAAESASAGLVNPDTAAAALVLLDIRPSLRIGDDRFQAPVSPVWRDRLIEAEPLIRKAIPSVGRVTTKDHPHPRIAELGQLGAAWMIGETVAATNRHVARAFGYRSGQEFCFWSDTLSVGIDFLEAADGDTAADFHVARILDIDEDADSDIALLQLDARADLPQPLILDEHCDGEFVVTVGDPAWDPNMPPELVPHMRNGVYGTKRLAPGRVVDAGSESRFRHDASTFKGGSGSVVLSLETGHAVGLQVSGSFGTESRAVSTVRLKERMRALALTVAVPAAANGRPFGTESEPVSAEPVDPDGYDPGFLAPADAIPLPGLECAEAGARPGIGKELRYTHFSVVMHEQRRLPICAACNIDGARLSRIPRNGGFVRDRRLAADDQWDDALYRHSPFDRGQLIGRPLPVWGDCDTARRANDDAFFFTNAVPQHGHLNRTIWLGLEDHVLDNAAPREAKVSVFTGCVFDPADPLYRGARIPREFWKIVAFTAADGEQLHLRACGFLMDQSHLVRDVEEYLSPGASKTYQLPIDEIVRRTGLDLRTLADADVLGEARSAGRRPISQFSDIAL